MIPWQAQGDTHQGGDTPGTFRFTQRLRVVDQLWKFLAPGATARAQEIQFINEISRKNIIWLT